jgi:hypothetical protein
MSLLRLYKLKLTRLPEGHSFCFVLIHLILEHTGWECREVKPFAWCQFSDGIVRIGELGATVVEHPQTLQVAQQRDMVNLMATRNSKRSWQWLKPPHRAGCAGRKCQLAHGCRTPAKVIVSYMSCWVGSLPGICRAECARGCRTRRRL